MKFTRADFKLAALFVGIWAVGIVVSAVAVFGIAAALDFDGVSATDSFIVACWLSVLRTLLPGGDPLDG